MEVSRVSLAIKFPICALKRGTILRARLNVRARVWQKAVDPSLSVCLGPTCRIWVLDTLMWSFSSRIRVFCLHDSLECFTVQDVGQCRMQHGSCCMKFIKFVSIRELLEK